MLTAEINTLEIPAHLAAVVRVSADSDLGASGVFPILGTATATNTNGSDNTELIVTLDNRAPAAVDDVASTDEDVPITVDVLANDGDLDNDPLVVINVTGNVSGTAVLNPDYTVTFTPTLNFNGVVTLTYTISDGNLTDDGLIIITVNPVNDPPVAIDDFRQIGRLPISVTIDVLDNDFDIDNDILSVISITSPLTGTASISGTLIVYTPTVARAGVPVDQFVYTISDGQGAIATATVRIEIQGQTAITLLNQLSQPTSTILLSLLLFLLPLTLTIKLKRKHSRRRETK